MSKSTSGNYADKLALYEALVATNPTVERKGDTMPYTSLNGNMFSLLTKAGKVALRLPSDARDAFLKKHRDALCVQYGIVMKEYVELPDALLSKTGEAKKLFEVSFEYARSLKPKPTTKNKAPAKKARAGRARG
jgi:hypothetical protein